MKYVSPPIHGEWNETLHARSPDPSALFFARRVWLARLDDYLIFGQADSLECNQFLAKFLKVCEFLGIPVAMDKVDGPATVLTFLGLELDSVLQQIRLPAEKLQAILKELEDWQQRKKATKRQLLSLIGKLSFAARAVPAGRLFTRRLITLTIKVKQLHHHIRLNDEAQADILWWKTFLPSWNGTALFVDRTATAAIDLATRTLQVPMAVELTTEVPGFTMTGSLLNSYPQYSGKNYLPSLLQPLPGDTTSSKRRFSFTVIISP